MKDKPVRGRFAPSPSGRMHLGNVFSALLAWLGARAAGGSMILRVEDLDTSRSKDEYVRALKDDLLWLGLDWDEGPGKSGGYGPYVQSLRGRHYSLALDNLKAMGLVYPCFCTRGQLALDAANAPHQGQAVYDGRCRSITPGQAAQLRRRRPPALRLMVPDEIIGFTDGIFGPVEQNLARECGDFILRRSDGVFAYQLAAALDDAMMEITQVTRGRDLLSSTARQIYIQKLLGYTRPPAYYHTPLLLCEDGRRLSKRDKDLDMGVLRQYCRPEQLIGFLASLCGLLPRYRPVSAPQLVQNFSWEKIKKEDIIIDGGMIRGLLSARDGP